MCLFSCAAAHADNYLFSVNLSELVRVQLQAQTHYEFFMRYIEFLTHVFECLSVETLRWHDAVLTGREITIIPSKCNCANAFLYNMM